MHGLGEVLTLLLNRFSATSVELQGAATAKEINSFLKSKNRVDAYPLFKAVYEIAYEGRDVESIVTGVSKSKL